MLNRPNIMVCTDFTSYSDEALKAAATFTEKSNGTLTVLHVSEHPVVWEWLPSEGTPYTFDENVERDLMRSLRKKLESQMARCEVKADNHISMGIPAHVILDEIESKKIDLLIMGHKGKTAGEFRIGSLASKVVAASPKPVMIIKKPFSVKKVGALVDPAGSMEEILKASEDVTKILSAQLEVLSLFPDISAHFYGIGKIGFSTELLSLNKEQADEVIHGIKEAIHSQLMTIKDAKIRVDISREKKLAYHLNTVLEEENVDLVVMKKHQAGFFEKILIGSETRRMMEIFNGNLLILPP